MENENIIEKNTSFIDYWNYYKNNNRKAYILNTIFIFLFINGFWIPLFIINVEMNFNNIILFSIILFIFNILCLSTTIFLVKNIFPISGIINHFIFKWDKGDLKISINNENILTIFSVPNISGPLRDVSPFKSREKIFQNSININSIVDIQPISINEKIDLSDNECGFLIYTRDHRKISKIKLTEKIPFFDFPMNFHNKRKPERKHVDNILIQVNHYTLINHINEVKRKWPRL